MGKYQKKMTIDSRLVVANIQFSFKLFLDLVKQNLTKNIFISPYSVATSLAMTYNGARGETQEAIAKTLELQEMNLEEVSQGNANLRATLEGKETNLQIYLANSLWVKEGVSFGAEFLRTNDEFYQGKIRSLNFHDPNARSIINDWVKQSTNGKIEKVVDQIEPNSIMFLINAAYFKVAWSTPFPIAATQEHPFLLLDGTQKQHLMMFQSSEYRYLQNDIFQAINIPYGEGIFSMYIFLPNKGFSINRIFENLTSSNWNKWTNQLELRQVYLGLPRFKFEYSAELNDTLKSLGMQIAFDGRNADFSGMCPNSKNICIDKVKHKTFIEVNEQGTEASAATSVEMVLKGYLPEPQFEMIVDRPFLCTIQDNQTRTILFMGTIVEPG